MNVREGRITNTCRECFNQRKRELYAKSERTRERVRLSNLANYERRLLWYQELKRKPCADCGVDYPPHVLDFDHVRGEKVMAVGTMMHKFAKSLILAEIAKCDLVCANCHRNRTFMRRLSDVVQ